MSRGRGAGYGAVTGMLVGAALIGLPVAFGSADARQVEWLWNLLFVAVPLVLLGALAGAAVAGSRARGARAGDYALVAIGTVALVLVFLAGTTNLLS